MAGACSRLFVKYSGLSIAGHSIYHGCFEQVQGFYRRSCCSSASQSSQHCPGPSCELSPNANTTPTGSIVPTASNQCTKSHANTTSTAILSGKEDHLIVERYLTCLSSHLNSILKHKHQSNNSILCNHHIKLPMAMLTLESILANFMLILTT